MKIEMGEDVSSGRAREAGRELRVQTNLLPDKIAVDLLVRCCLGWILRKRCWNAEAIGSCPRSGCLPDWTWACSTSNWRPND